MTIPKSVVTGLRWAGVLPLSYVGAALANIVVVVGNQLTMAHYIDPDSFRGELFIRTIGSIAFGTLFVVMATLIAPCHKSRVAIFVAGLSFVTSILIWMTGLGISNGWDKYALIVTNIGSIVMCIILVVGGKSVTPVVGSLYDGDK